MKSKKPDLTSLLCVLSTQSIVFPGQHFSPFQFSSTSCFHSTAVPAGEIIIHVEGPEHQGTLRRGRLERLVALNREAQRSHRTRLEGVQK